MQFNLIQHINPSPKQCEYLKAAQKYKYVLYGGARGGGKSYIERWRQVLFLLDLTAKGFKNLRTAIFSTTFNEVRTRQFVRAKAEFPEWLGTFNESLLEFRFKPEYGSHTICFCNMEKLETFLSQEYATIGIEEATASVPSWEIVVKLAGSVRCPGVEHTPICITGNPGGIGTSWVKGLFVTKDLFFHPDYERLDPDKFKFVQAFAWDNPYNTQDYLDYLKSLPPYLRALWLEGSWDILEGNRFNFNPKVHVVEPFKIEGAVNYYAAMDYGFRDATAFGIYAILITNDETDIYKIKEINVPDLDIEDQADLINSTLKALEVTLSAPIVLDPSCWQERGTGLNIADRLRKKGLTVQQAKNDRPTGWVSLEQLLHFKMDEHGNVIKQPRMKIFNTCTKTIQQITDAMWDPKKEGDILHPDSFRDDSLDETRYFAYSHFGKPKEVETLTRNDAEYWQRLEKQGKYNTNRIKIT